MKTYIKVIGKHCAHLNRVGYIDDEVRIPASMTYPYDTWLWHIRIPFVNTPYRISNYVIAMLPKEFKIISWLEYAFGWLKQFFGSWRNN